MRTTVKLGEAEEAIVAVLAQLRQIPEKLHPFVVISDELTGRYVQFSGSDSKPLWFDAPQLGVVNTGPKFEDPKEAAAYALAQLRGPHRLPNIAELEITFETTHEEEPS